MMKIRSILVASDLSEGSDEIVAAAGSLAAATEAELHLLHAFDFPAVGHTGDEVVPASFPDRIDVAVRALQAQAKRSVPPSVKVGSTTVEIYVAHRAILDAARGAAVDLIVLGPHRRGRTGDGILGSTADRVLRTAKAPCLVVRAPLSIPLRKVVTPVDLSEPARGALDMALEWSTMLGQSGEGTAATELLALHVLPRALDLPEFGIDPDASGARLHREIDEARQRIGGASQVAVREEVRWGDRPVDEIVRAASEESADLLVLGTHGHGVLTRALIGSVASGVAARADCPVLLVPPALWEPGATEGETDTRVG